MAIDFSGANSHRIDIGSAAVLDNIAQGNVLCWVWPTSVASAVVIYSKNSSLGTNGLRMSHTSAGLPRLSVDGATDGVVLPTAAGTYAASKWCFLCFQWDRGGAAAAQKIFHGDLTTPAVEMSAYTTQTVVVTPTDDSAASGIIANDTTNTNGYTGYIAYLAIVTGRLLPLSEIVLWQRAPGNLLGMVDYRDLRTTAAADIADRLGNNAATLTGGSNQSHPALSAYLAGMRRNQSDRYEQSALRMHRSLEQSLYKLPRTRRNNGVLFLAGAPPPTIDLVAGVIIVTPGTPTDSQTVNISGSISNAGGATATSVQWRIKVDGGVVGSGAIASLAGGASTSVGPTGLGPYALGVHTVLLEVDYANLIVEDTDANNTSTLDFTVSVTPVIDLQAGIVTVTPSTPTVAQTIDVGATVMNTGNTTQTSIGWQLKVDGAIVGSGSIASLAGGASSVVSVTGLGPYSLGGHTATLVVDPSNTITEVNEADNTSNQAFTVGAVPGVVIFQTRDF